MPGDGEPRYETVVTERRHRVQLRRPEFTVAWTRSWVVPDNVLLDTDTGAEMDVRTEYPEARPTVALHVEQGWDHARVPALHVPAALLKNKVVRTHADQLPSFAFDLDHEIWEPFDKLEYHFKCRIDDTEKCTTTALLVKRWHVQAVDTGDTRPSFPAMRASEKANFEGAFAASANDKAMAWEFPAGSTSFVDFGEKMQNTYTFVYTGHGAVMCRTCGHMYASTHGPNVTDADFGTWTACPTAACAGGSPRSTHCIGPWKTWPTPTFLGGDVVADEAVVPSTPKYLMFSICCGGAFEPSLYDSYIGRGTKYCVGFRKSTRCDWARDYAKAFLDTWAQQHRCDPSKIPSIFNGLLAAWKAKLQPVLFAAPVNADSLDAASSGARDTFTA